MCFTDFPTETCAEARATIQFLHDYHQHIALFICGQFGLTHGADVALHPEKYGIGETWHVAGDDFQSGLFYTEQRPAKTDRERDRIDDELGRLSDRWWLHWYPWAGALSTAHTLLWYDHYGPGIFREMATTLKQRRYTPRRQPPKPDPTPLWPQAWSNEAGIWHTLTRERRAVSRAAYRELADKLPKMTLRGHGFSAGVARRKAYGF